MKQLLVLVFISVHLLSCNNSNNSEYTIELTYKPNEYVGEKACIQCHTQAYNDWKGSHHDWAMKLPNDSTVLGDFSNTSFNGEGEDYFFYKKDSLFYVKTGGKEKEQEYEIAYTFGVTPLQQYLIKFPDGKYQTLRATWDTNKKEWFNQYRKSVV